MAPLLKDLYNEEYINLLSSNISLFYPSFEKEKFVAEIFNVEWNDKELKERMHHIASSLGIFLSSYKEAIEILQKTFHEMNYSYMLENMIFQDFVEIYGLDDFGTSMQALECFTMQSSSEFAIRQFILKYPTQTMLQIQKWSKSENEHVRRLASEGCRPRLPWAIALPLFKKDPTSVLKILEILKDDASAYVRKSVANNLNDISKDNPEIIKRVAASWVGHTKERDALLKHGCRTLLKASDSEILKLFGCAQPKNISLKNFQYLEQVTMGESLHFSFDLESEKSLGKLRLEFAIGFLRKNAQQNKKVFKLAEANYQEKSKSFKKVYSFKPISTRNYYTGEQTLQIIINGLVFKKVTFTLL